MLSLALSVLPHLCSHLYVFCVVKGTQMENGAPVPTDGQYGNKSSWPEVERDHAATITYLDAYVV